MSSDGRDDVGWPHGVHGTALLTWLALRDLNARTADTPHYTPTQVARVTSVGVQATSKALRDLWRRRLVTRQIRDDGSRRLAEYGFTDG